MTEYFSENRFMFFFNLFLISNSFIFLFHYVSYMVLRRTKDTFTQMPLIACQKYVYNTLIFSTILTGICAFILLYINLKDAIAIIPMISWCCVFSDFSTTFSRFAIARIFYENTTVELGLKNKNIARYINYNNLRQPYNSKKVFGLASVFFVFIHFVLTYLMIVSYKCQLFTDARLSFENGLKHVTIQYLTHYISFYWYYDSGNEKMPAFSLPISIGFMSFIWGLYFAFRYMVA